MFHVFHVRKKELTDKNKRVEGVVKRLRERRADKTSPAIYEREGKRERKKEKEKGNSP